MARNLTNGKRTKTHWLPLDAVYSGNAPELIARIAPESIACSVWSPPYHVGKAYEAGVSFDDWKILLRRTIAAHQRVLIEGGFLVVNIADILCFRDESMPRIQAPNVSKLRSPVTREDVLNVMRVHPGLDRYQLAALLQCSEQ